MALHISNDYITSELINVINSKGHEQGFNFLFDTYDKEIRKSIMGCLYRKFCYDPPIHGDEITQEMWISVYSHLKKYAYGNIETEFSNVDGWLYVNWYRKCLSHVKECSKFDIASIDTISDISFSELPFQYTSVEISEVRKYLNTLDYKYRKALLLFYEGYKHEEIAIILNISIETSRTWRSRGVREIRKLIRGIK